MGPRFRGDDSSNNAMTSLLRFIACGSVDDGKSTLIGRLLADTGAIPADQMAALAADSARVGTQGADLDYALLVDGLAAEREQGITIDVAYRFFASATRKFIVADTPGHVQYTRNMVTGASTADLAIILVDATQGVLEQTRRHSFLVHLLGVRQIVLAVNKMDLAGWSEARFAAIVADYTAFAAGIGLAFTAIPVCGLTGDNIVARSAASPWFAGPTLLEALDAAPGADDRAAAPLRLAVQWVNRPNADFRGYAGLVSAGHVAPGDRIQVLPSGREATVARVLLGDADLAGAEAGQSVTLTLTAPVDISRGDLLTAADRPAEVADRLDATLVWMADAPAIAGGVYWLKAGTRTVAATIAAIDHRDRHRDTRRRRRRPARPQRHRRCDADARPRDRVRPVHRQPRHRRLHPDRPRDQRHRRGRHDPRGGAGGIEHPLAGDGRRPRRRARRSRASARRSCGSPACRERASRPSPTSSRRSCLPAAATPRCSTATTSATA